MTGHHHTGQFYQSSLNQLVTTIITRLSDGGPQAQALLHLPPVMIREFRQRFPQTKNLAEDRLFICKSAGGKGMRVTFRSAGTLPQRHPLRNELLLVTVSESLCALVSAQRSKAGTGDRSKDSLWNGVLAFSAEEVSHGTRRLSQMMDSSIPEPSLAKTWLHDQVTALENRGEPSALTGIWSDLLVDLAFSLEQRYQASEGELKWFQIISQIQDAVGWELNTGKLFAAIAQVLKTTIGFQYLEIQLVELSGKKYDVTAVHHRNDTTFGGQLLTIILRPERRVEILRGRKPVLIDATSAGETLMNPRLMDYMALESGVITPLVFQRRSNGLLKLFSQERRHFTPDDLPKMEAIGRILARSVENVKVHSLMRRMATIDGLTNLHNRRFLMEQLSREFKRSRRYHSNLTLIMIDVDNFKHYNDSFGHLRGDHILITASKLMQEGVREVDLVARYGGEEFAIILPEANLEQGLVVAEKIRKTIENHPFKFGDRQPGGRLTLSFGLATNTDDVENINELINRADMALYRAKKKGRNRCETF